MAICSVERFMLNKVEVIPNFNLRLIYAIHLPLEYLTVQFIFP